MSYDNLIKKLREKHLQIRNEIKKKKIVLKFKKKYGTIIDQLYTAFENIIELDKAKSNLAEASEQLRANPDNMDMKTNE